jgi:ATP-dependent helicase/nuclease subunit B
MGIQRTFLGWKRPALVAATEYLLRRYVRDNECDLSEVIVVIPGSRAGRRLLELLVQQAEKNKLLLTPPQIVTEGKLPEFLYEPQRPLASLLVQQLTWLRALQQMPPAVLRPLVPHPPAVDDPLRWLELAEMFRKQHAEFAADAIDFNEVLKRSPRWDGFNETDRWQTLAKLQRSYLDQLDELHLWDAQTARLVAIQKEEPKTDCDVILLGMVDANTALRRMLDLVAPRVTALVIAPEEQSHRFDDYGCLIAESWQQLPLRLSEEQMERVDGPAEQAGAVVDWLRDLNGKFAADEIIVGVADEALVPQLQREIAQQGLTSRWVEGKRVAESAPYRLLEVATRYAERRRFVDLAACVRHPDVYEWLQRELRNLNKVLGKDLLTTLDLHYEAHLSSWLDGSDLELSQERDETARSMFALVSTLEMLFAGWPTTPQPVGIWMQHAQQLLKTIYGEMFVEKFESSGRYLLKCLEEVQDSLLNLAELPEALQPTLTLVDAVELALQPLEDAAIAPLADSNAIEILGWLELPLDDAPALVITTVNEGFVPNSPRIDAFLPDAMRRELGLQNYHRRYARDAYALHVLANSRHELKLISARRDTKHDPLAPSRLLFTGSPEAVAQRALRWFSPPPPSPPRPNLLARGNVPLHSKLPIPQPLPQDWGERVNEILQKITVTQFKAYLACPYRFYLGHVLRLQAHGDQAAELDALAFGNLIHDVLQEFGRETKIRRSSDPKKLRKYFDDRLDAVAAERCRPRHARAAVRVQIEQARIRLRAFADWQAQRTDAGWQIVYSEDFGEQLLVPWSVDDEPIGLRGRIDRIDYHPGERTLAILDYKTGDAAKRPDAVHRSRGEWVDLQLPLYRHLYRSLLESLPIGDVREHGVELGYITLPKDPAGVGDRMAEWSTAELEDADEQARHVVRSLRAGTFWPPNETPAYEDEFTAICQDLALGRSLAAPSESLTTTEET